jgi:hypothetical protein
VTRAGLLAGGDPSALTHSIRPAFSSAVLALPGLVGYWRLDELAGILAADSAGANDGTYTNGPTLGVAGSLTGARSRDAGNPAAGFQAASHQQVVVPDDASLDLGDTFTLLALVKPYEAGMGTVRGIIAKGVGAYYLRLGEEDSLELLKQGVKPIASTDAGSISPDEWHFCAAAKDGEDVLLAVAPLSAIAPEFQPETIEGRVCEDTTEPLRLGSGEAAEESGDFDLDEVVLSSATLDEGTLYSLFRAATNAPPPPKHFVANFEDGLVGWSTAGVGDAVPTVVTDIVRDGTHSAKVLLTGTQDRSELIFGGDGDTGLGKMLRFFEGDGFIFSFSFYIVSMVYGEPGAHNLLCQLKGDDEGGPAIGLQLWDYEGDHGEYKANPRGLWSAGAGMSGDRFLALAPEKAWHDVVVEVVVSNAAAGSYTVTLDGEVIDSKSGVSTIPAEATYAYIKCGNYRNGAEIPGTNELRLDACRVDLP